MAVSTDNSKSAEVIKAPIPPEEGSQVGKTEEKTNTVTLDTIKKSTQHGEVRLKERITVRINGGNGESQSGASEDAISGASQSGSGKEDHKDKVEVVIDREIAVAGSQSEEKKEKGTLSILVESVVAGVAAIVELLKKDVNPTNGGCFILNDK